MCMRYEDFLARLKEERVSRGLSQEEMGKKLGMAQSHYCKAETGLQRFTYAEMKRLCKTELDIYYIFTGNRCSTQYQKFFMDCTYEELKCCLAVLCPIASYLQRKGRLELGEVSSRKAESVPYSLEARNDEKTVFYHLRRRFDCNQKKMAEILDVDVKKVRNLEYGKKYPDSELIWKASEELGLPFALILDDEDGLRAEVAHFAELIGVDARGKMLERLKIIYDMIRKRR